MAGHHTAHACDDLVPLAWAGLMLQVPPTYRPFKIDGHARKGLIGLDAPVPGPDALRSLQDLRLLLENM